MIQPEVCIAETGPLSPQIRERTIVKNLITAMFLVLTATICLAQNTSPNPEVGQVQANANGTSTLKLDGIDIDFDASGNWSAIYSTYTQPVDFPDRRGIKKAQIIAEEKGKAQIIRFLNQEVSSDRLVEEVDKTVENAERTLGTGKDDKFTRTSQRQMVESVKEFTHSFGSGNLRGVTVLETGYNEKAEEVWVRIGISRKTIAIANSLGQGMNGGATSTGSPSQSQAPIGVPLQPSENRGPRAIPQ
jgi:hypothetical protein